MGGGNRGNGTQVAHGQQRLVVEAAAGLARARSVSAACHAVVRALGLRTSARVAALLHVHDHLRCVAATGSWRVFSSVKPTSGVAGQAFTTGVTQVALADGSDEPGSAVQICAPVCGAAGEPIGALNLEWPTPPQDVAAWQAAVEEVARQLGARVAALGGPPAESRSEKLLRHAGALAAAGSADELLAIAIEAARDVARMSSAVLLLADGVAPPVGVVPPLEAHVRAWLAAADPAEVERLVGQTRRYGASYTLGSPERLDPRGYEPLVAAGARSMITIPVGPDGGEGVLLVLDGAARTTDPATVNRLELLAAQAWSCLERLRTLAALHTQASSDPLTGLGHQGPFERRLAAATPGRTALLAIDVDRFKSVNDTYGHQAGDRVLVRLAQALQGALRHGDALYRTGGDEFVAVLDVQRPAEALLVAERLNAAARRVGRTVSVGAAVQAPGESAKATLERADAALYEAKRKGRDAVRLAG